MAMAFNKTSLMDLNEKLLEQSQLAGDRYERLSKREQWIIKITLVIAIFLLWQLLFLNPKLADIKQMEARISNASEFNFAQTAKIESASLALQAAASADNSQDIIDLKAKIVEADIAIETQLARFAAPGQLHGVVQDLFNEERISLNYLNAKPEEAVKLANNEQEEAIGINRHSFEVEMQGSYFEILDYFARLDGSHFQFVYDSLKFSVEDYPNNKVSLNLYTMSLDPSYKTANKILKLPSK